jgi:hypothetical protein
MGVSGDKKSEQISLAICPPRFHKVSKIVQAHVVIYDEIFQALAVEGDVLLPKPFLDPAPPTVQARLGHLGISSVWQTEKKFLDLGFDGVIRRNSPSSDMFFSLPNT